MRKITFTAGDDETGMRLDRAVLFHVEGTSRSRLQQCIETGLLRVNGLKAKAAQVLRRGDRVTLDLAPREAPRLEAEDIPIRILYQDRWFALLDKPAGMVVHPGAGVSGGTLANALAFHFGELPGADLLRPGIVHRLDKETSGLLLVTLTEESQLAFSRLFHDRKLHKEYAALVHGHLEGRHGRIDKPIGRDPYRRTRMSTRAPNARPCLTEWFTEREYPGFTLLRVILHTGRTHQIRVHLASAGHPVAGDATYGGNRHLNIRDARLRRAVEGMHRFFLHARKLGFTHPFTGQDLSFEAPLPPELVGVLNVLETA